jgi:hypothetical protein
MFLRDMASDCTEWVAVVWSQKTVLDHFIPAAMADLNERTTQFDCKTSLPVGRVPRGSALFGRSRTKEPAGTLVLYSTGSLLRFWDRVIPHSFFPRGAQSAFIARRDFRFHLLVFQLVCGFCLVCPC